MSTTTPPTTAPVPTRTTAVVHRAAGPLDGAGALHDVEVDLEPLGPRDLLVAVRAVSVNPVDTKLRAGADPGATPRVLGYDAAGVVVALGDQVTSRRVGDAVWYAGNLQRAGSDAALQVVDERLVAAAPTTLGADEAAALPLTAITAWEVLVDHLHLGADSRGTLLVVGAAGGVGSMVIQLARVLTGMRVIATASRARSRDWVRELGAHEVIDHHDLLAQGRAAAPEGVDAIVSPHSAGNVETYAALLRPRGAVVAIDEPEGLDTLPLKERSQSWHWEFMGARPAHEPESTVHREVLEEVARLVDAGRVRTTMTTRLHPLDAATLTRAHALVEAGSTVGKVVVAVDAP